MLIVCTSQKGGVGKTTSAVSLATALPEATLVDLDPQGHCAISLGLDPRPALFDFLVTNGATLDAFRAAQIQARPQLSLVAGDSRSRAVEIVYRAEPGGFDHLIMILESIAVMQDGPVLVDTAAGGMLQEAAIAAADVVVVPVRCELLGLDGVNATLSVIRQLNPNARAYVLPTGYDKRLREHNAILEQIRLLPDVTHPGCIVPARVAVAEAVAYGHTIWEHNHPGLNDVRAAYQTLAALVTQEERDHVR